MKIFTISFFLLLIFNIVGFSQTINTSNIHYTTIEDKIEIFYDLPVNHDSIRVTVIFYKNSDPNFKYYPKEISGEVGVGKFSGKNKKITWYWKKEPTYLFTGSGYYFKVIVTKVQKQNYENEISNLENPLLNDTTYSYNNEPLLNADSIKMVNLKKEQEELQRKNDSLALINKQLVEEQERIKQKQEDSIMQVNKRLQELKDLEIQQNLKNQKQIEENQKNVKVRDTSSITAPTVNFFGGYGSHGIIGGFNYKIFSLLKYKSAFRIYLDIGGQDYTFTKPITFNGLEYNSDSRIISYGAGIAYEYFLFRWLHLSPFAGFRFDDAQFKNSFINSRIGNGELIRYVDGFEVGSRLNKDYGTSGLMIDIGGCVNIKLAKHFWLFGKIAVSPVKYNSNKTIYGKYWADTPLLNDYAIRRQMVREEVGLSFRF